MSICERVFYFNVNYSCNSDCVFCYSHNTRHDSRPHNEISIKTLDDFITSRGFKSSDRIIINGGEPLLHSDITNMLEYLCGLGCEVLIYTNGRLLDTIDLKALTGRFRFIVPVHGSEGVHDSITRVKGSYRETVRGMESFSCEGVRCLLDMKVIINPAMINDFSRTLETLRDIYFSNSLHITNMARTPVAVINHVEAVPDEQAAVFTARLFEAFWERARSIKLYDTCISALKVHNLSKFAGMPEVYYCDYGHQWRVKLEREHKASCEGCEVKEYCISEVREFKVLEFCNNQFREELE